MSFDKEMLIKAVSKFPAIWDKRHGNHHNRYVLMRKWKDIGKELGCSDTAAKATWKNLRQDYGRKLLKEKSGDTTSKETWPYFQYMSFMKDQFSSPTSKESTFQVDNSEYKEERWSDIESYESVDSLDVSGPSTALEPLSHNNNTINGHKDKINIWQSLLEVEKERLEHQKARHIFDPTDEDVGFFNSLLPYVKQLDGENKLIFRMKTQQLLFELLYTKTEITTNWEQH